MPTRAKRVFDVMIRDFSRKIVIISKKRLKIAAVVVEIPKNLTVFKKSHTSYYKCDII